MSKPMMQLMDHPWLQPLADNVVGLTYPPQLSAADLDAYIEQADAWLGGMAPVDHAWVVDASNVSISTFVQRSALASHLKRHEDLFRNSCKGMAVVVPTAALRGMMQAITWLVDLPYPHKAHASVDDATTWALQQLTS